MTQRILFITSTRIGDALLSTGILSYILKTYPDARLTIACGPLAESLFEGVPSLDQIIPLKKQTWNRHWFKLWRQVVGREWEMVVDLRNSAVSRLVRTKKRYIYGGHIDKTIHKIAQNASVIGVSEQEAPPRLFLSSAQIEQSKILIPDGAPVLGLGPTANWIGKIWPVENFKELARRLTADGAAFAGWRIAVFGAPNEEEMAYQLYDSLPPSMRINCIAKGNPGQAAAYIARCQFYVGNDSGLMHSAALAGIPTVGLFGPTNDVVYAPYGPRTTMIHTPESMMDLIGHPDFNPKTLTHSLMGGLSVEKVEDGIKKFI